jgi:hypothetical protein
MVEETRLLLAEETRASEAINAYMLLCVRLYLSYIFIFQSTDDNLFLIVSFP